MEPTRELASVDLAAIRAECAAASGAYLQKAYVYPEEELYRLKLRHPDRGRLELLGQAGDWKRLHLADPDRLPAAPTRPPNVAKMLRNRLSGGRLAAVEQHEFDRIITVSFDVEGGTVDLVFELFGDGNVIVIGTDETIIDCLRTVRLQSRTVRPGGTYDPPASRVHPFRLSADALRATMRESDTDVVRTLATTVNLGGRYAREVCARADVAQDRSIDELDDTAFEAIHGVLETLGDRIESLDFDPRIYADDRGVVDVAPVPLETRAELSSDAIDSMNEAVDVYFHNLPERRDDDRHDDRDDERAKLERIIDQQTAAIEEYEQEADRLRAQAERLYARYEPVNELLEHVRQAASEGMSWADIEARLATGAERGLEAARLVEAVDPAANRLTISLDGDRIDLEVDESLEHNAERLYREAKELEQKREGAIDALEETRQELEALADSPAETPSSPAEPTDWRNRSSIPIRAADHWYERFRWFHTSDEFLVIGGRSAKQNEELVNKYTEPTDRVVHSQAHGGPVTVIKASAPDESARDVTFPEGTLEEAAQFAVSYSSVWKDGHYTGDAYVVEPDQLTKEAESGEYLDTGAFAVRGDRRYFRDVAVGVTIGISCAPETRVVGGPPSAVTDRVEVGADLEPGRFAQSDVAKRLYRRFRGAFEDERFVRRVASADRIQPFLPPGGSRIVDD